MPKTIYEAFPNGTRRILPEDEPRCIRIAECFSRTIQGEGRYTGKPATFLRVQHCTLNCVWCDTAEVWRKGNPYTITEIVDKFEKEGVLDDFKNGHHLVLTGGSPVKQQKQLTDLLYAIEDRMKSDIKIPFVEVETECTLIPETSFAFMVDQWNCSPKLENSGMPKAARYKPDVLSVMARSGNADFKFVVTNEEEWNEIVKDFIEPFSINKNRIFLMPEGQTREELQARYDWLVDLACREGVQVSDRLHVTMWNKKTGV